MNLLIFLSDRCNMACDYCFLALNVKPANVLRENDGQRAIDAHLARFGSRARFTLLGGEPLLHPELALGLARRARAAGACVSLVTNGTKADSPAMRALLAEGVEITVSLDGRAQSHDAHRRTLSGRPTHAGVTKALSRAPVRHLRANLVISEDTAGAFLSNVEWLRASGFGRISFHADAARPWSLQGLRVLRAALQGFARYARALDSAVPGALSLAHFDSYRGAQTGVPAEDAELTLGGDGRYYASDAWLSRPYGKGLDGAVGDARTGVDWDRRRDILRDMDHGIGRALRGAAHYTWPRETWALAALAGGDPPEAVRRFHAADAVLGDALSSLSGTQIPAGRR